MDGTLYVSRAGRPYMVFCHEWVQIIDGEVCAVALTDDLSAPIGDPFTLFRASDAPWQQSNLKVDGKTAYVTDGPFLYRTADCTLLCLWSSFSAGGYTEGVAVSDNGEIDGRFTQAAPLFHADGGHAMIFRDQQGQLLLSLHSPNSSPFERPFFHPIRENAGLLERI